MKIMYLPKSDSFAETIETFSEDAYIFLRRTDTTTDSWRNASSLNLILTSINGYFTIIRFSSSHFCMIIR